MHALSHLQCSLALLLLCVGVASTVETPLAKNYSVAVVVAPGFYLLDAMGPLDVFRAVQTKAYADVNLSSHEWRPGDLVLIDNIVRGTALIC